MIKIPAFLLSISICTTVLSHTAIYSIGIMPGKADASHISRIDSLINKAYDYRNTDREKYLFYAHKADSLSKNTDYYAGRTKSLNMIGTYHLIEANYPKAFEYYQKALEIAEKTSLEDQISAGLNYLGIIYFHLADYVKACFHFNLQEWKMK